MRYVEGNPVRARLVQSAKDWVWSSHRELIGTKPRFLADEIPIELPSDWNQYVDEHFMAKELAELRESVNRGAPYGLPTWRAKMGEKLGLQSTLRPRGRPKRKIGKK